jgi:hypothetical protein
MTHIIDPETSIEIAAEREMQQYRMTEPFPAIEYEMRHHIISALYRCFIPVGFDAMSQLLTQTAQSNG